MNSPTLKQLRYLIALEETLHFGKAAELCCVSQSAFSAAIKELESLLGTQLVDRTNKSVVMTQMGKLVTNNARICLKDLDNLMTDLEEQRNPLNKRITMGVIPTIAPFLLPGIFREIGQDYPHLKLYCKERFTEVLLDNLNQGELDVILIALPYELKNLEVMPLYKDYFYLACSKNSQLVNPQQYSIESLDNGSVFLLEADHCLREHTLSACNLRSTDKVNQFTASSLYTLLHMVNADLGVTFIPEIALDSALMENTEIRTYPLDENSFREIALVWRKNSSQDEDFRMLGELIKRVR